MKTVKVGNKYKLVPRKLYVFNTITNLLSSLHQDQASLIAVTHGGHTLLLTIMTMST